MNFAEKFDRTRDIQHYGVMGMRWGVQNKTMAEGIQRGAERGGEARDMESWELKDKVDRMKLESDYRKLTEEEETYAVSKAQAIRKAKMDQIEGALRVVNTALGTINGVSTIVNNSIHWHDAVRGKQDKDAGKRIEEAANRAVQRALDGAKKEKK